MRCSFPHRSNQSITPPPAFVFRDPSYDDSRTTRRDRTHAKSPGTSKEYAWGTVTVSAGVTNFPPETRLPTIVLAGFYTLGPISSGYFYQGATVESTFSHQCDCNTVMYRSVHPDPPFCTSDESRTPPPSMFAACTACQNVSTVSWTLWTTNCSGSVIVDK